MCSKEKEKTWREKLIWKKRNHFIQDHRVKPISPFGLVQLALPGCCLLHSSVKIWKTDLKCPWRRISAPVAFSSGKSLFILDDRVQMQFSSCTIRERRTCLIMDKVCHCLCLLLLSLCQCVSEENDS